MIGKEILNYRIVSLIGQGGMGSVYMAEHKNIEQQKAAIKVINADMVNEFTRRKLREEAEHLATLKHQNIVSFYDYHIDADGNIYLVMEYANGKNLEDYINSVTGLIVEDRVFPLFGPILDAFEYAHKHHIVHRDIKPSNIIITEEGIPKVLDFGIATIVKDQSEEEEHLVMGTPSYMSPEQVRGEHVDHRSDIYSLGVLLHQMMTGNAPYDTTTLTDLDINKKVLDDPLPRMKTYYKYVSEKVQKVVDKATAKDPKDRYQSCAEFKKALQKAIHPPKTPKWVWWSAAAAVIAAVGCGVWWWDYTRVKTYFYKDYVERWGVPEGIGEISSSDAKHTHRMYRFETCRGRVQRVSHVNSAGKVIVDGESERLDKPIDQYFTYTEDGHVSRVKVANAHEGTEYIKVYNENLQTVTFCYDDEHNTPKYLANRTVGYTRSFDNNEDKGRINGYWIEYDENGLIRTIRYNGYGRAVCDNDGIYGISYHRDEKGRPIVVHYLDANGDSTSTNSGLAVKKFTYDSKDNWTKAEYFALGGERTSDAKGGVYIYELEYDEYENIAYAWHQDASGQLMIPHLEEGNGTHAAGIAYTYDEHGFETKVLLLGIDKKPIIEDDIKCAGYIRTNNEFGFVIEQVCIDTDEKPCEGAGGVSKTIFVPDEYGYQTEVWEYNLAGKLQENEDGYSGNKCTYDESGNLTKVIFFGTDKKPCLNSDDIAGVEITYNELNLETSRTCLGTDLKPCKNKNQVAIIRREYDGKGNMTRLAYYREKGDSLCISGENIAGWYDTYDDFGNLTERSFFNELNELCECDGGYAKVVYTYDANNNMASVRYMNASGELTLYDDVAGYDYVCDSRGNKLEVHPIGLDGQAAKNRLVSYSKYDSFGNNTETAYFMNGEAAVNNKGVHKYAYLYNKKCQLIEESHYGKDNKLVLDNETGVAIIRIEYDYKGYVVRASYFNTENKPGLSNEKWSISTFEHNAFGQVTKQCFFGIDGKYCDPKDMCPIGIYEYDRNGNQTLVAAQDENGHYIINPNTGWAIRRSEWDKKSNKTSESYYDENDKPMKGQDGYHKAVLEYDTFDNVISLSYYGTDSLPVLQSAGYHKETRKYNDNGKLIESAYFNTSSAPMMVHGYHMEKYTYNEGGLMSAVAFYNTSGKAVDSEYGYHKKTFTYNSNGKANQARYYNAAGKELGYQNYNFTTGEWGSFQLTGAAQAQPQQAQQAVAASNWQANVRKANSECPMEINDDLVIQSVTVSGNSVVAICKMPEASKYDLSENDQKTIRGWKTALPSYLREKLQLPRSISVTVTILDKANRPV